MNLFLTGMASLNSFAGWLRQEATASPILGGLGLLLVLCVIAFALIMLARMIVGSFSSLSWRTRAARMKSARRPGYFFLVAPFEGRGSDRARAFTQAALTTHLSAFSFNAPYEVHGLSANVRKRDRIENARAMMVATEADLVVWGSAVEGKSNTGIRLQGLVRHAGGSAADAANFSIWIPGDMRDEGPDMSRLLAYAICRQVQPALGRPEDFRADRLEPIARRFGVLLEAYRGKQASTPSLRQLQDDYAAAALHIGESKPDDAWLETAARAFEAIIASGRAGDADRWVNAKLGLGRAMLSLAERKYDPVRVQEGTAHVRAALDVLRGHAKLRAADQGIAALRKAEQMLENRRRFSITWPV